jgi:hypothetical protein
MVTARKGRSRTGKRPWQEAAPYHVVARKVNGAHQGYDLFCKNRPFLRQIQTDPAFEHVTPRLKRPEAYAIVRLLNTSTAARKWAAKFGDPYA